MGERLCEEGKRSLEVLLSGEGKNVEDLGGGEEESGGGRDGVDLGGEVVEDRGVVGKVFCD